MPLPKPPIVSHARLALATAIALGVTGTPHSRAGTLWNEQVNGDFSDDRFVPTPLSLPVGASAIACRLEDGDGGQDIDLDYFSVTIPAGHQLAEMLLVSYLSVDRIAFIAIQPGPIFPNDPGSVGPDDLMGYAHFGPALLGQDLLTAMGFNGQGFAPPLPAGTYSFWVQQTDNFTEYSVDFRVEEIPGPHTGIVALAAAAMTAVRRRRRTHRASHT